MKKIIFIIAGIILLLVIVISIMSIEDTHLDTNSVVQAIPLKENNSMFEFPQGYYEFHKNTNLNYFLNRIYSLGYGRYEDMEFAGKEITDISQWKKVFTDMAKKAQEDKRFLNAAFYYRAAEFYTLWEDKDKMELYQKFNDLFYQAVSDHNLSTDQIPYNNSTLSILNWKHSAQEHKGTIILHAGYDSFKEELASLMAFFASHGYDVINFDLPWMSHVWNSSKTAFDYHWESIIKTIIDYYNLEDVTLVGISFGGWLALRSAAFEPRIKRVIASSVSYDVNQYAGLIEQIISDFARKNLKSYANEQIEKQMKSDFQSNWFFNHLMHVTQTNTPIDAANKLAEINEQNLNSERVTQDVLILTGYEDHLVPFKMHNLQLKALKNAASVTPLVFTDLVNGQNHCQIGNMGLALTLILDWIESHE